MMKVTLFSNSAHRLTIILKREALGEERDFCYASNLENVNKDVEIYHGFCQRVHNSGIGYLISKI